MNAHSAERTHVPRVTIVAWSLYDCTHCYKCPLYFSLRTDAKSHAN